MIDYTEKIPNNVDLGRDRVLQRALEHWQKRCNDEQPGFLNFGEASAKAQVCKTLKLSRNEVKTQKDRFWSLPTEWLQYL